MRKSSLFILGIFSSLSIFTLNIKELTAYAAETDIVYVGGMSAGFTLKAGGAQIIGTCEISTQNGAFSPAATAGLRCGDKIVKVAGIKIDCIQELNEILNQSGGKEVELEVLRNHETITILIKAVKEKSSNRYKIGVLAKDNISGIGTVTYIDGKGKKFASLGHPVSGKDNTKLSISDGKVFSCSIVGVNKGARGKAGELKGMFLNDKPFGTAEKLCNCGIFGSVSADYSYKERPKMTATSKSVTLGDAYIYSTVNGIEPVSYEIEIVKVDKLNKDNKNFVIKIKDEELLALTGGIVQGMSGSPIVQNDKLVGAITHVFLNDPTRGYGIDIENMLRE